MIRDIRIEPIVDEDHFARYPSGILDHGGPDRLNLRMSDEADEDPKRAERFYVRNLQGNQ